MAGVQQHCAHIHVHLVINCRLTYFLVNHFPADCFYQTLELTTPILEPFLVIGDALARASAQITGGVEAVRRSDMHSSYFAQIICGTIAASGGGLIGDFYQLGSPNWGFRVPLAFRQATIDLKIAFAASLIYSVSTHGDLIDKYIPSLKVLLGEDEKGRAIPLGGEEARALTTLVFVSALLYKRYLVPSLAAKSAGEKAGGKAGVKAEGKPLVANKSEKTSSK